MPEFIIESIDDPVSFEPDDKQTKQLRQEKREFEKQIEELRQKIEKIDIAATDPDRAEQKQQMIEYRQEARMVIMLAEDQRRRQFDSEL